MIRITPLPAPLTMRDPATLIATGFGSGRIAPAPGTWGTAAALIPALALVPLGPAGYALAAALALILGLWAVGRFEAASGSHDLGMVVIDEWAGLWLALAFAAPRVEEYALAFLLFRLFDAWKPGPIGWLDRKVAGAWGVMVDDLAAGLTAGVLVFGYERWMYWY
ncbi:MAG: phosphatidylglycerophosphatase A [Rhodospirillales bacterium]|nr:phosphatidylglycerophosphatase A [Alphaproteobacteria bacterium]MCB9987537.1 phosphatidylglycerophosphatase A [Rhodospirillales bacterium]USO07740.1 MAG: phosphatidylglycerophosphatase A [Rhodospirillales bacterium]